MVVFHHKKLLEERLSGGSVLQKGSNFRRDALKGYPQNLAKVNRKFDIVRIR